MIFEGTPAWLDYEYDRTPANPAMMEEWLAKNTVTCEFFEARVSKAQCDANKTLRPICSNCKGDGKPGPMVKPPVENIGRHKMGTCPSCKREGIRLHQGNLCWRCIKRIAKGEDVMLPSHYKTKRGAA